MKVSVRNVILGGSMLLSCILFLIAFTAYRSFETLKEKTRWVQHTHAVLADADKLLSLIINVQNGQRGFAITGDSLYLQPYFKSIDSIDVYVKDLKRLTADNVQQQRRVDRLETRIIQAIDVQKKEVRLKAQGMQAELMQYYASHEGKESIDGVIALMQEIKKEEQGLLTARTNALDTFFNLAGNVLYGIILFFALTISLLYYLLTKQFRQKEKYEEELTKLNDDLYHSNKELVTYNEELNSSREELFATVEQLEFIKEELEKIVEARTASLQDTNNRLVEEINLHKYTALALLKSQERFKIASETTQFMVFNTDPQGRYTWVHNPQAGFGNQQVMGKTDAELLPGPEGSKILQLKQKVFETGKGLKEEIKITGPSQKIRYFIINLQPLFNASGELQEITGSAFNITDRKQAEKNLQNTLLELQKRNNELDNYVYKVSHDLRAPLTSIMGLINLIHAEEKPETVRQYIGMIENRVNKLDDFIKSVLNHSRSINSPIQITHIRFHNIITDCIEELKYLPNSSKIQITTDLQEKVPFYSDELRLTILFKNFISNSIKYLNPNAPLNYLKIEVQTSDTHACIRLEDNGIGISQEHIAKIYQMFFRATQSADGSGLGLYIVKQNIEKLQGKIEVASEINKGTAFTLTLPNLCAESPELPSD